MLKPQLSREELAQRLTELSPPKRPLWEASLTAGVLLLGLIVFDWPPAAVFGFFWLENLFNGAFHVAKMLNLKGSLVSEDLQRALDRSRIDESQKKAQAQAAAGCLHFFAPAIFVMHYGMFCGVHLAFVAAMFDGWASEFATLGGAIAIAAILLFGTLDVLRFRRSAPTDMPRMAFMFAAYDRVVILHVAILFGGYLSIAFGQSAVVYLLIALKFYADVSGRFSLSRQIARKLPQRSQ